MTRVLAWLAIFAASILSACGSGDPPDAPPSNVTVTAGDASATVTWTTESGLKYWIFYAEGPLITYDTRTSLTGYRSVFEANSPNVVSGLKNGTQYSFIVAATDDGSKAGPASLSITVTPRPAGATWNAGSPLAPALNAVAFGATQFAAVGAGGAVFTSPDAITWTAQTSNTTSDLNAVAYLNDRFVAVGAGGTVITSVDGITWSTQASATANTLYGLGLIDGQLVAVGALGTIVTTGNGSNWSAANSGTTQTLYAAAAVSGRIVAVGAAGTILTAQDANSNWTSIAPLVATDLRAVSRGTDVFAIVGDGGVVLWSADGQAFSTGTAPATGNLRGVAFGSQFAAVGASGAALTSADGKTWVAASTGSSAQLNAVAFGSNHFSAVGAAGTNLTAY